MVLGITILARKQSDNIFYRWMILFIHDHLIYLLITFSMSSAVSSQYLMQFISVYGSNNNSPFFAKFEAVVPGCWLKFLNAEVVMMFQGFITVGHPGLHASRSTFDQHEDMRLDVDNMSYEVRPIVYCQFPCRLSHHPASVKESPKFLFPTCLFKQDLLELGERIGTVSTGLSEDSMSKCLKKTIHRSRGQLQDEDTCVICLVRLEKLEENYISNTRYSTISADFSSNWLFRLCLLVQVP